MKTKTYISIILSGLLAACAPNKNSQGVKSTSAPQKNGVALEGVINGGGGKGVLEFQDIDGIDLD